MITQLINKLIPEKIKRNDDLLMRSYVMIGIVLVNSTTCFLGVLGFIFFLSLPPEIWWVGMSFVGGGLIAYSIILLIFVLTGNYFVTSNGIILLIFIMIYAGIMVSGGFANSVMVQMAFLSPALAFLLTGLRAGIVWLLLTCTASAISLATSKMGIGYVELLPPEESQLIGTALHFVLFFMLGGAILIYEIINKYLQRKLNLEKDKFKNVATLAVESSVVTESASTLARSASDMLDSSIQQKSAIEELVTTAEELNATAQQNINLATTAQDTIQNTESYLETSKQDVLKLLRSMDQIKLSGKEIQNITDLINGISRQTNLLSLNAMIEASRASEGAGGFKVVAVEVKRLAESSASAADDINKRLESNFSSVQEGADLANLMHQRFEEITEQINPVINAIKKISNASFEQGEAVREITLALSNIDEAINNNQKTAEETSKLGAELRDNAQKLLDVVESLDVDF